MCGGYRHYVTQSFKLAEVTFDWLIENCCTRDVTDNNVFMANVCVIDSRPASDVSKFHFEQESFKWTQSSS